MNLSQAVRIAVQVIEKRYTEHRMKVNGLDIHYTDWGNPDSPHMFLAHGAVANAIYWDLVAPAFQANYHIVAVTARGRAKSDYSPTGSYRTEDYVQDFHELTMALGMEKLTYVGQSMGGKIGMTYAAMYPGPSGADDPGRRGRREHRFAVGRPDDEPARGVQLHGRDRKLGSGSSTDLPG